MKKTVEVLKERIRLTPCIQNLNEIIKPAEQKQEEIKQIQEALKKHEDEMKKNEKFTKTEVEHCKVKKPINDGYTWWLLGGNEGALCCTVCEETCHYPGCTWSNNPKYCEVMKDDRCTICTNHCPPSDHVKVKWRYVTEPQEVEKTDHEMKEKFEKSKSESENKSRILEDLKKEMDRLTAKMRQFLDEYYQHVIKLEQIALKADSASTVVHLDFQIEKMKEEGDTEKIQNLEEMRGRVDERTKSALRDIFAKLFKK